MGSFESDDIAMCDLGQALNFELVQCTVLEKLQQLRSSNNYGVEFWKDGALTRRILPVSRIRRIVKDARDLAQYASFAQTLQQSRAAVTGAAGGSLATFSFPEAGGAGAGAGGAADDDDEEEDLYS